MSFEYDQEIDFCGLSCPMPILKTKKAIDTLQAERVLIMVSNDTSSLSDVQAWTFKTGHELLGYEMDEENYIFFIKRKLDQTDRLG